MACYVISNDVHIAANEYKFGYTLNTNKEKLLERYNTPLNSPKILLFYHTPNAKEDETEVLIYFKDFRCKNSKGNFNEWLKIDFEVLKEYLDLYFSKEEYKDFRDMNLKQIELKVETLRLKVAETQLKVASKEWKILVSKALKDEEYLLELLNLYAKPNDAIDLEDYYEKYEVLSIILYRIEKLTSIKKDNRADSSGSESDDSFASKNITKEIVFTENEKTVLLTLLKEKWSNHKYIKLNGNYLCIKIRIGQILYRKN